MASPRPYVAVAAAAVLAALYFVPSAHADTATVAATSTVAATTPAATSARTPATTTQAAPAGSLAETGMIDTKPYVIGGAVFLLAGAGLVVNATRRSRHALQVAEAAEDADPEE
ncbi:hypothetical protein OG896_13915 [Streptomyces sp. NBC_00669]|uniref:hypothetical protein n=1 Tax=unclassified Streptomyces TaxID=2593676 RepID=UPI002E2F3FE4|nr:hypothetical protein [Streptomyces sp. NBC_00669]